MDSRLADFLIALSTDPRRLDAFEADPESAMAAAGLSATEREAVRSRNPRLIRSTLQVRPRGRLTVVGTGVRPAQLTPQARLALERAQKVFYLLPEPALAGPIHALNGTAESLRPLLDGPAGGGDPQGPFTEAILAPVRRGLSVCAAFFGHPGVLAYPARRAVQQCRQEGFPAEMLPGISAQDCLYADLGVDPGQAGCQSYEATDFLVHRRRFDPTSHLILWQIGAMGTMAAPTRPAADGLSALAEALAPAYGPDHRATVYEPDTRAGDAPRIVETALAGLPEVTVTLFSMLYVPPLTPRPPDPEILARMGLSAGPARE
jgi:hypothetical protein